MINSVKTNLFWLILMSFCSLPLKASKYTPTYIEQYKTIVLNEMHRTGIPASIKMAQAILESGSGRSTLARQSNNHFGIKCGKNWNGGTVYREDDDYKDGLLIRSCFRAYDDPANSFIAHSDFLMKNRRYGFLFELDPLDYVSWARGLKKAGYATDPKYPQKLINLIEKYELYNLDLGIDIEAPILAEVDHQKTPSKDNSSVQKTPSKSPIVIKATPNNSAHTRYALNDGYYTFRHGDKMRTIAAHFKVEIKELYFRNRLNYGDTPKVGSKLAIRSYIHFKDLPETVDPQLELNTDYLFEETISISSL